MVNARWWKVLAVAMCALLSLPAGASISQQPVVTGHTVYTNMDGLDPCLAGVVGVVRMRVMWFNNQVLMERAADDGGNAYIYAIEADAPDPRDQTLLPTGNQFKFTDPNGVDWLVNEYNFTLPPTAWADAGNYSLDPGSGHPLNVTDTPGYALEQARSFTTWIVKLGPTNDDYAATGKPYNFVDIVDTCKMQEQADHQVTHTRGPDGNWTSSDPQDPTFDAHEDDDTTHTSNVYDISLYIGQAPQVQQVHDDYLGSVG
jgi:hypothetical protein